jgi:DNA primase
VDEILRLMAHAPPIPGQGGQVKQELIVTRLTHRLGLRQETVWARFEELRSARKTEATRTAPAAEASGKERRAKPAKAVERELLQILLAEPGLVRRAYHTVRPEDIEHPGLQQLLAGLYRLYDEGAEPTIDGLRETIEKSALIDWAMDAQEVGRTVADRRAWFETVLRRFRTDKIELARERLLEQVRAASTDDERARLLREIQDLDKVPATPAGADSP